MSCKVPALDYFKAVLALPVLPQSDTATNLHMHQVTSHPAAASTLASCSQRVCATTSASLAYWDAPGRDEVGLPSIQQEHHWNPPFHESPAPGL